MNVGFSFAVARRISGVAEEHTQVASEDMGGVQSEKAAYGEGADAPASTGDSRAHENQGDRPLSLCSHFTDSFLVSKAHISHGAALTILLPYVMEFNLVAVPNRYIKIAEWLGEQISGLSVMNGAYKSVEAVRRMARDMGMMQRLRDVGISEADIPQIVGDLFRLKSRLIEIYNPRNAAPKDVAHILKAAL